MNKGLWIARKNYLWALIKQVSDAYGGDDPEFLKQHWKEVIDMHPDEEIEKAISCYQEMAEQAKFLGLTNGKKERLHTFK